MADLEKTEPQQARSALIGNQAQPTILDSTTKIDIDVNKTLIDNIIEAGLHSSLDISALENFTSISNARDQIYQLIDTMCQDSSVSSIVRTYSEDVCEIGDNGHIVWCESADPKISQFINYLLNIMNVDKQIFGWVYSLIKYGDVYLRLYRESDYADPLFTKPKERLVEEVEVNAQTEVADTPKENLKENVIISVRPAKDKYSYYIEMVPDPSTMFELTKFGQTYGYIEVPLQTNPADEVGFMTDVTGTNNSNFNFRYHSNDVHIYQADEFVHASLIDNISRYPETVDLFTDTESENDKTQGLNKQSYTVKRGKSLLYDAYKIWREKALLESAILLSRITRSGIVRKVGVEVGDMPKPQVQQTLRRVKEMFEQKSAINTDKGFGEYTNPGAVENFIYYATHDGKGAITVESVGGDFDPKQLTDLDWWNNKFYASFGIPKQYFGWTDDGAGFNGGSSLTVISSVYSKGVKRVQNTILQAITDAINLFLLDRGCKSYLNNFVLKMRAPLTQEEIDFRENFNQRVSAISNVSGLFTDIEDKARRLKILNALINTLNLGSEVQVEIQKEIEAAEEAAKKADEEAEAEGVEGEEAVDTSTGNDAASDDLDLDLAPMPDSALEQFNTGTGDILLEDKLYLEESDELPSPEELNDKIDFTENN
jgi:hypothetical protein